MLSLKVTGRLDELPVDLGSPRPAAARSSAGSTPTDFELRVQQADGRPAAGAGPARPAARGRRRRRRHRRRPSLVRQAQRGARARRALQRDRIADVRHPRHHRPGPSSTPPTRNLQIAEGRYAGRARRGPQSPGRAGAAPLGAGARPPAARRHGAALADRRRRCASGMAVGRRVPRRRHADRDRRAPHPLRLQLAVPERERRRRARRASSCASPSRATTTCTRAASVAPEPGDRRRHAHAGHRGRGAERARARCGPAPSRSAEIVVERGATALLVPAIGGRRRSPASRRCWPSRTARRARAARRAPAAASATASRSLEGAARRAPW